MAQCSSVEPKQMLSALHAEEMRLIEALSAIRAKLNDLAPISTLPIEILENIFEICASWMHGHPHQKPAHRLSWSQVCRRWRLVSLNASWLWRLIDLSDSCLAHECLVRSRSAPIHLGTWSPAQRCFEGQNIEFLRTHAERVKSMSLYLFPEDITKVLSALGLSLPTLTSLALTVPPVATNFILHELPALPHLTSLSLDCVSIPWDRCMGLTHLSLRGQIGEYCPSFIQLRALCDASPNLQVLHLACINPVLPDDESEPELIFLDRLQELSIVGLRPPFIKYLLSHISLSPHTLLNIRACSQYKSLLDILPTSLGELYTPPDIHSMHLSTSKVELSSLATPGDRPNISFHYPYIIPRDLSAELSHFFDLSCTTTVELGHGILCNPDSFPLLVTLVTELPALEALRIGENHTAKDLLEVLSQPIRDAFFCPRLKTLSFGETTESKPWYSFGRTLLEPLVAFATARHSASLRLETLEFLNCVFLSSSSSDRLKDLVDRVILIECGLKDE